MEFDRELLGETAYNNLQVFLALFVRTHIDLSNYHAATFTLRKRPSHGLQFDLNYTFSKSLDQLGGVQNNAGTYASSFNPNLQYGPSLFDRTHVFNAIFNYDLPAGSLDKDHQWLVCDRCVPREQRVAHTRCRRRLRRGAVLQQRQHDCDGRSQFAGSQRSQQCLRIRWSQRTDLWKRW